jgi:hypothetical protein
VSGTVENQGRFYDRFHHVVLLSAPLNVLLQRVTNRANPYGRTPEQRAQIAEYVRTVEPLLRRGATVELDGRRQISELADAVKNWSGRRPDLPQMMRARRPGGGHLAGPALACWADARLRGRRPPVKLV